MPQPFSCSTQMISSVVRVNVISHVLLAYRSSSKVPHVLVHYYTENTPELFNLARFRFYTLTVPLASGSLEFPGTTRIRECRSVPDLLFSRYSLRTLLHSYGFALTLRGHLRFVFISMSRTEPGFCCTSCRCSKLSGTLRFFTESGEESESFVEVC